MKKQLMPSLVAIAVLGTAALSASAQNLAIVNGKPVPLERVTALKQQIERSGGQVPAEMDDQIKEEIINREIFMQEAAKRGLETKPAYKQQMQMAREAILIRELFEDFQKNNPVTDAEVKAEYDKVVSSVASQEYQARHILLASEDRAKAVIAEIKAGKKFEDIAKQESKDPGSATQGGELGWTNPATFVPEFGNALLKMKKGELSEAPTQSQFGWHVIRVDDVRTAEPPALDDVKPQIVQQLEQQKAAKFQEDLRAKAKIQ